MRRIQCRHSYNASGRRQTIITNSVNKRQTPCQKLNEDESRRDRFITAITASPSPPADPRQLITAPEVAEDGVHTVHDYE
jgi:hypothetical protein